MLGGAGDQHHVEPSGAHGQVLDTGDRGELGAERSPIVLLDVDEHQRRDAEAERVRIDGCREAGDHLLVTQPLQSRVGGRSRHVDVFRQGRSARSARPADTAAIRARSTLSICRSEAARSEY